MSPRLSCLIVIPTYNERENIAVLVPHLRELVPYADLLIVDDGSPDGTGALADDLANSDRAVHVLHRAAKDGLGRAYVAGLGWGVARGYDRLVQMDADLSHDPAAIPGLLTASLESDVVLGSRYVTGGATCNWGFFRRSLSQLGSRYARVLLGLSYRDMTGGFKCWRRSVLEDIDLPAIRSNGYTFQIEMTYRAAVLGHSITEIPITFTDRVLGSSKMNSRIIREAVTMVWWLRSQRAFIRGSHIAGAATATPGLQASRPVTSG